MQVEKISFDEISKVWALDLWKDRQSPITPMSSMVCLGGYDMSIYNNVPTFFAIKDIDKIVAVNSGHMTINGYYRSRGLWVDKQYRRQGLTYILFNALYDQAKIENAKYVWSFPKEESLQPYIKNGFTVRSNIVDNELGPHYYVLKNCS